MTTTVRSVRVQLEASVAGYIRDMKLAGSETDRAFNGIEARVGGANRAIGDLDTTTGRLGRTSAETRVRQTQLGDGIDKTGRSANRAEASIDKYSGRLKTILGLITVLGPAALRLGLGSLPALSAGFAGLGAAGGGIGVTIAALHGVGDALEALNEFDLERTPENLRKVQAEFARLGPDGAHFVQVLRDLQPELRELQLLSRAGVLPGFESFIDSMVTRLPIVTQIVNRLSREVGLLATDAGESLAGEKWTPFFEYVRSSAAPILDDFARSTGNVALGLANLLVALDPLTRKFTGGLEDMTQRFADWSDTLEDDEGFQDFLDAMEQAGPDVLAFLGSAVSLMGALAHASAPVGKIVLPALTATANALAAIGNSPIGPVIYTAATAWLVYSRAASLADKATTRIQSGWDGMSRSRRAGVAAAGIGLLAAALTDYDDKAGVANTTTLGLTAALAGGGPLGIGLAATVGLLIDVTQANDDLGESITRAQTALNSGDTSSMRDQLQALREEIEETDDAARVGLGRHIETPGEAIDALGAQWSKLTGEQDEAKDKARELEEAIAQQKPTLASTAPLVGDLTNSILAGADAAIQFSEALGVLHGWFDKRAAVRGYKDAIDALAKGLKDGFSREDVDNIDALGQSILQVAEQITDPGKQAKFLAGAREQLVDLAERSGPAAAAAIQQVIDKFDSEGLTNPPPIKLTAEAKRAEEAFASVRRDLHKLLSEPAEVKLTADDGSAVNTINGVDFMLDTLGKKPTNPKITVNPGNSLSILGSIVRMLNNVTDRSATVRITTIKTPGGKEIPLPGGADGMTVPGPRTPYGDKMLIAAAPGEEVISNRHGQADRFRADRASGRIPSYASGGSIGSTHTRRQPYTPFAAVNDPYAPFHAINDAADQIAKGADATAKALKKLETAADKVQRSYDKQKAKLDDLISQRDSTASSIAANALHDPFGNGLAGLDAQLDADSADLDAMTAALATLVANGLSPKSALYQQLAAHMDVNTAQQLAALSAGDLAARAQRFEAVQGQAAAFGQGIAGEQFNEAIRDSTRATNKLENRLESLEDAIRDFRKNARKDVRDGAAEGSEWGAEKGSEKGTRAGQDEKRRRTAATKRTGGGSR